jgi:hypothetical protein
MHVIGDRLAKVVTSRPSAAAYRVERKDGGVVETLLKGRVSG